MSKQTPKQVLQQNVGQLLRPKTNPVPSRITATRDTDRGVSLRPVLESEAHYVGDDELARLIVARQLAHLDAHADTGRLSRLAGDDRKVIATSLRLAARDVLEGGR